MLYTLSAVERTKLASEKTRIGAYDHLRLRAAWLPAIAVGSSSMHQR